MPSGAGRCTTGMFDHFLATHRMSLRLDRALRQYLKGLDRSGVTHLPVLPAPNPVQASTLVPPSSRDAAPPTSEPSSPPTVVEPTVDRPTESPRQGAATVSDHAQSINANSSTEDRAAALCVVADLVAGCTRCTELAETRTQTVFGVGDPNARILFIGEAPGADEDAQGQPFVGRAGQLLTKIIEACKLKREDIYICNVLRCRPPGNRNPTDEEASNCREYLDAQIAIVRPEYIVCWGAVAARNLLDSKAAIGKLRKKFHEHAYADTTAKVLCTYHPSYLLRNPAAKKDVWSDMQLLFADMGVELK